MCYGEVNNYFNFEDVNIVLKLYVSDIIEWLIYIR